MINVKLCMMVLLIELCLFIPLSVTLVVFQGEFSTIFDFHTCSREVIGNFLI